jgi:hypothetical protein
VGEPPAGRHLVSDRTLSGVFLSPSEQAGVPSYVLAAGPLRNPGLETPYAAQTVADVYRFADGSTVATIEGLAGVAPAIENLDIPDADPTGYVFATDSRGRLLFVKWNPTVELTVGDPFEVWRLDPSAGDGQRIGWADVVNGVRPAGVSVLAPAAPFLLAPGRTQVFTGLRGYGWLVGLDAYQFLFQAHDPTFIGEDFYCAGMVTAPTGGAVSGTDIVRITPGAAPEVLFSSTGPLGLGPVVGNVVPQLVLTLATDAGRSAFALLDTETFKTRTFPPERGQAEFVSASPSGQLLLFRAHFAPATESQPADDRLFIFDWATNQHATLDSAGIGKSIGVVTEWRPGTNELWLATTPGGFAIWRPDGTVATVDADLFAYAPAGGEASVFTADGRHWFAQAGSPRPTVYAGLADDPRAPLVPLNPPGTQSDRYWLLDDGRLLVEAWVSDYRRNDSYLVDVDAGTARALGSAGKLVAVGRTRALALLDWQLSRASGELTLIDYANGASAVLDPDVYAVAVDRGTSAAVPPGTDALAPGTRVAFLGRNRLVSPDDGLWVAELP